jgi:outer membrane protein OmpA-like peptidoglycan-associated protein/tetratricopeptide (TPR) repeat protein
MRKKWLLLILATVLVSFQFDVNAQQQRKDKYRNKANDPVTKLPYYKKLRWADNLFSEGSYFNAIEYYLQLKQEQERNPYLAYQLAECYSMTRDYKPAAHFYGEAYSYAPKIYPEAQYYYALNLKKQGEYEAAIAQFNKFIADNPKTFKKQKIRAKREIEGAQMAINSVKNPEAVNVINAGPNVNSAYTESAPYPLGDSALLFSTMRQNNVVEVDKSKRDEYMARFMTSKKQDHVEQVDSFQWAIKFQDGDFNSNKVHIGNGSYSPGGDRFYFTKCTEEDSMEVICKIYVSKFEKSKWTEPEELASGINEGGSNTQPFAAKVGKKDILFFSSNRTLQGRGGYDIWYSVIDPRNGTYRRPQNAGKQVNTDRDEQTPYYDARVGKLYFASNGWVTMGGFDIFSADGGPSRYTNLKNMGYPINTSADELYFIKDPSGKPDAYLVSNRIGSIALKNPTCCDDIWRIQYEPQLTVLGKVVDRKNNELVSDVVAKIVDQTGDLRTFNSTDGNFTFSLYRGKSYVITGDKQGYASTRASINTMDVKRTDPDDTVSVTLYLDELTQEYRFRVSNVYYDYDKSTLRPESTTALDTLAGFMKDNPSLTAEVYSFADAKGTDDYNKKLSERRAQAVIDYLTTAGIEASRMESKGFGESLPAAPNASNGKDNPVGRQLNRRTEFRIVTDVPTRRILFNSAKPGSMDEQQKNLQINNENLNDEEEATPSEGFSEPGGKVNKK